jgi:predicted nucleic acid-binding protein
VSVLIDSSAWIEYLRATGSPAAAEVRRLLSSEADTVVMCEPVAMEILAGATSDAAHAKLERLVNGLPSLRIDDALDFRSAAAIFRRARRIGRRVRSINDCLIASVAIRHEVPLIHRDADYGVIAAITPLTARSFV